MTVRVWMRPSELGEQGYSIDVPEANAARIMDDGTLRLRYREDDESEAQSVGRVAAGRWDLYVVLDEDE